jgi:Contractile injection system tube protein
MTLTASPKLIKGGLIVLDVATGAVRRTIALQYNPDTLTRSYQVQGVGGEAQGERAQPFRFKGPAIESIKLEAEIDATDFLEHPEQNGNAVQFGIAPQLAALEGLVNPTSRELVTLSQQSQSGTLEILPPEAPLVLFIWSASRVVPVRVTEFSVTEEAFDPALNPIRAKVSLGLRVMTTDDLGFAGRGGGIFLNYLRTREALAGRTGAASLQSLGLSGLPQ